MNKKQALFLSVIGFAMILIFGSLVGQPLIIRIAGVFIIMLAGFLVCAICGLVLLVIEQIFKELGD